MRTVFKQNQKGEWHWHTKADNNRIVADSGEGYGRIKDAANGYFVSQGENLTDEELAARMLDMKITTMPDGSHVYTIHYNSTEKTHEVTEKETENKE